MGTNRLRTELAVLAMLWPVLGAKAQTLPAASQGGAIEEITVTAEKREESINAVPMSVTAVTGDALKQRAIEEPADLVRVTPGLTFTPTQFGASIFTLRGVGYYENSLSASPAVTVYVDEVPLPYPLMATGAFLDLDRVEVLKGPQGTLFGENSTGGAINYVAAKPTRELAAGADVSYGRFDTLDVDGFVSGPITEQLSARLAVKRDESGPWQRSLTRGDELGRKDQTQARLLLDWRPADALKILVNLNGWHDGSDTQAPQVIAITPEVPSLLNQAVARSPIAPADARAADWYPGYALKRDNSFYQGSARVDWDVLPQATVTSLTSYEHLDRKENQDINGTAQPDGTLALNGVISSFSEELRVSTQPIEPLRAVLGLNYQKDEIKDAFQLNWPAASNATIFGVATNNFRSFDTQNSETRAVFANLNYDILDGLKAELGARYTENDRSFGGCTGDTGDGLIARAFVTLQAVLKGAFGKGPGPQPVAGGCANLNANYDPAFVRQQLNQDNASWRVGLSYEPFERALVYANISQGYKSGNFPTLGASTTSQYTPVTQEKLIAYEVGFKAPLNERTLQLNGALFYYDYKNKQISANVLDQTFGVLQRLINVPKSYVEGGELALTWSPVAGLVSNTGVTYSLSHIQSGQAYDQLGNFQNLSGKPFPYSPRWSLTSDTAYNWPLLDAWSGFVGASVTYHSGTTADIGGNALFRIDGYALLDLRAGVESDDGHWRVTLFGKNVTNTYYWNNVVHAQDTTFRYTGLPATYGITASYRY